MDKITCSHHPDINLFDISGASDDAVSCALMLEVLRVMASEEKPFRNEIIFLFNGAEESILQVGSVFYILDVHLV